LIVDVLGKSQDKIFNFEFPLAMKDAVRVTAGKPLFYVGKGTAEFSIKVNVSDSLTKNGSVKCSLLSDNKVYSQSVEKLKSNDYKISIETDKLDEGFYSLKFEILDESGKVQTSSIYDFAVIPSFIDFAVRIK